MIVFISYDDGDIIMLYKIDLIVVIFDYFVCYSEVYVGQCVIGFWFLRIRYYFGVVIYKSIFDNDDCYQKVVYYVVFDDGDK